ncbi:MAG: GNAT family N-acetyltransferase [Planctomycetes bacterium]|nr:GNAT family N-acetyltransferase [Planctomycetota bacterium]
MNSPKLSQSRFRCLEGIDGLNRIAKQLDAITDPLRVGGDRPWFYVRSDWLLAWAQNAQPRPQIFTFLAEDAEGNLQAAFPAALQRVRIGQSWQPALTALGWPENDTVEIPSVSHALRTRLIEWAWAFSINNISGWRSWMLRELDRDGPTLASLQELQPACLPIFQVRPAGVSPMVDLVDREIHGDKRSSSQRSRATKYARKLKKEGDLEMRFWLPTPKEVPGLWDELQDVELRSWRDGDDGTFMMQDSYRAKAYRRLWEVLAAKGELGTAVMRLNGQAIAAHWGYVDGDRFLSVHESRDVSYSDYGVGLGVHEGVVTQGRSLGLNWIDTSRGNSAGTHVLGRYGGPVRHQVQVVIPHPGWRGALLRLKSWRRRSDADAIA